jgi:hypothetical protein
MPDCPDCEQPIHSSACRRCGWTMPAKKPVTEAAKPWTQPVYPDPPATSEEARAAIAKIKALLAAKMTRP